MLGSDRMPYCKIRRGLVALAIVLIAGNAWAQSEQKVTKHQTTTPANQRETDKQPIAVKLIPTEKSQEDATQEAKERAEKSTTDKWLIGIGVVQCAIFLLQLFAFLYQSARLRDTVKEMRISAAAAEKAAQEQSADMKNSLTIAKDSAEAGTRMATALEDNAKRQMRAYISALLETEVPQDRSTGWRYEIRMKIVNTGFTPAHAVNFSIRTAILDSVLPDTFDFSLPLSTDEERGFISYGGSNTISASLPELVTDEEINEIKSGSNLRLYVYGTVGYKDIFGIYHYTNFCQFMFWNRGGQIHGSYFHRHNNAT